MRTVQQLRQDWAPACELEGTTIDFVPGIRVHIDERAKSAFDALAHVIQAHGYHVRRDDTGSYNCRIITGGSGHSLHSFGIAIDVNWNSNPYRVDNKLVTDMTPAMIDDVRRIVTLEGKRVWRWGGDFKDIKDAMHFEVCRSPSELTKGINWETVREPAMDPAWPDTWPVVRSGDRGPAVERLQTILIGAGFMTAAEAATGPGRFGPRTEAAVLEYQRQHGLTVDGTVGLQTWTALLTDQPLVADEESPVKGQYREPVVELADTGVIAPPLSGLVEPIRIETLLAMPAVEAAAMLARPADTFRDVLCYVMPDTVEAGGELLPARWRMLVPIAEAVLKRVLRCH